MLSFRCSLCISILLVIATPCLTTFDINPHQLQMVADHLTLKNCRKLSESLHENGFERSHDPNGKSEPRGVSCIRLLEHWNNQEGKYQSFHLLATRLRQLGKNDIADKLAKSVSQEKIAEVRESFLGDPFKSRINKNSPLLGDSPLSGTQMVEYEGIEKSWTTFEILEVVGLIAILSAFIFLLLMFLFKLFLPDSFARMKTSFYLAFAGKRPNDDDNLYFLI